MECGTFPRKSSTTVAPGAQKMILASPAPCGAITSEAVAHSRTTSGRETPLITNPPAVPISVETFAVEGAHKGTCYDFLTVNNVSYCGTEGPEGIVPDGSSIIEWLSDKGDTEAGWKLCFPPSKQ